MELLYYWVCKCRHRKFIRIVQVRDFSLLIALFSNSFVGQGEANANVLKKRFDHSILCLSHLQLNFAIHKHLFERKRYLYAWVPKGPKQISLRCTAVRTEIKIENGSLRRFLLRVVVTVVVIHLLKQTDLRNKGC